MTNTVRFIHTADLHLDSPLRSLASRNSELGDLLEDASRTVLKSLVDTAIVESVDAVLIAGDLFDGELRDVRTAKLLERELRRLEAVEIPVFIIWGNHDAEARLTEVLELPSNVHTFDGRGGSITFADDQAVVHGVSFSERKAPNSLLGKYNAPLPGCFNIGMLHTSLTGSDGHNNYAPCTVTELIDMGYDYWALGHIHKRKIHHDNPAIVMPGNPMCRHINEDGERSISLVTLRQGQPPDITRLCIAPVCFERIAVSLDDAVERRDVLVQANHAIEKAATQSTAEHLIIRLELTGETSLAGHTTRNREAILVELRLEYEHRDDVWIDSIDVRKLRLPTEKNSDGATQSNSFLNALRELMDDELLSSLNLQENIQDDISALNRALPREVNSIFDAELNDSKKTEKNELIKMSRDWILNQLENDSSDSQTTGTP